MLAVLNDPTADQLVVTDLPDPVPDPDQLLVKVAAAGLNRADLNARRGGRKITVRPEESGQPNIAGLELAGEIVGLGSAVTGWEIGERVMARGRGYAELAVVDARVAMPVPDDVAWEVAGGMPVAVMTMHDALMTAGAMHAGDAVLIQAATSGVGVVGCRLAALMGASVIFATSRSGEKLDTLRAELGTLACEVVGIDTSAENTVEVINERTDNGGVDVVIDNVGASVLDTNLAAAAIRGRIVQVGRLGGKVTEIDLDELARKRVSLVGVTFRTRSMAEVREVTRRCLADVGDRLGDLGSRVDRTFPLRDARAAQDHLAENEHVGKLVLIP